MSRLRLRLAFVPPLLAALLLPAATLVVGWTVNALRLEEWLRSPAPPGHVVQLEGRATHLLDSGDGPHTLVISTGRGCDASEWLPVLEDLAGVARVIVYNRAGYAWSAPGELPRTSQRIAVELHDFLATIGARPPYVLVGHSNGGFYAQQYSRLYPREVESVVAVDPAAIAIYDEQLQSVDESLGRVRRQNARFAAAAKLGLVRMARALGVLRVFAQLHPGLSPQTTAALEQLYSSPSFHHMSSSEQCSLYQISIPSMDSAPPFPPVPLLLITVPPPTVDSLEAAGVAPEQARKAVEVHRRYLQDWLELSPNTEWVLAEGSGHMIHLDDPALLVREIRRLLD